MEIYNGIFVIFVIQLIFIMYNILYQIIPILIIKNVYKKMD